jgi:hypothetical protein
MAGPIGVTGESGVVHGVDANSGITSAWEPAG